MELELMLYPKRDFYTYHFGNMCHIVSLYTYKTIKELHEVHGIILMIMVGVQPVGRFEYKTSKVLEKNASIRPNGCPL
jgi:hypothetical protein